jgi:RNA polymerase sigma-70 factor (ECF subfamily)
MGSEKHAHSFCRHTGNARYGDFLGHAFKMHTDNRKAALDRIASEVYPELRRLAQHYLFAERPSHTLQPTALVHEVYLRMVGQHSPDWVNRAQFLGLAASMMRRILVNYARDRRAAKRDATLMVDVTAAIENQAEVDVLDLSQALERLGALDTEQERVVELRFFGGLSIEETAGVLGISASTVKRHWSTARLFLLHELRTRGSHDASAVE